MQPPTGELTRSEIEMDCNSALLRFDFITSTHQDSIALWGKIKWPKGQEVSGYGQPS
ncbi:hypothetical protein [Pusillimonas sp. ANT_WB101]|uniref:hypothetical protein n=1 Tax=Pusillimonas sp. ANT_WB101 TaxID=2597356 RepID=UPI00165DF689|nr:hypothetical protein [Pusillimonas sp. ANT_WB101]